MKSVLYKGLLVAMMYVFALTACINPKEYPETPQIAYKDFIKYGKDSAELLISFKDGDGDIGLDDKDTFPPFNDSSLYYHNFFLKYLYKNDEGEFVPYYDVNSNTPDTIYYKYRIPNITPVGQNKVLDGNISVRLFAPFVPLFTSHKSYRYDIWIYDRSLKKSNVISTPELTVE